MGLEETLVARARQGDRAALDGLVRGMKDLVYNLSIRMLGSPADAEDATQEILIRLVTNLDSFRGESAFRTWVYRVASNQLLKERQRRVATRAESFEALAEYLDHGLADGAPALDDQILVQEAKLRCTSGMLQCLDRDHRLAYILGEILELPSEEAAAVLEISPEALRKRLSRARARMTGFMESTCGLVNPDRPCRCAKQAGNALRKGALDPTQLAFATHPTTAERLAELNPQARPAGADPRHPGTPVEDVEGLFRAVAVFRSHPSYAAPDAVVAGLKELLAQRRGLLS